MIPDKHQQRAIDAFIAGTQHVRVPATAGSGKTTLGLGAVVACVERGRIDPASILVTTFTRKAADEFRARLNRQLGAARARAVHVGTYHSWGLRQLRGLSEVPGHRFDMAQCIDVHNATRIGKGRVWEQIIRYAPQGITGIGAPSLGLRDAHWRDYDGAVSFLRSHDLEVGDRKTRLWCRAHPDQVPERFVEAWTLYEAVKQALGLWSFADVLTAYAQHLEHHPEPFARVVVDEVQDNDLVQARIMAQWAKNCPVLLLGDVCQAVYAFRGAVPEVFLDAPERLQGDVLTVPLPTNYRSGSALVELGSAVVQGQPWALVDQPVASRSTKGRISVVAGKTPADLATRLLGRIQATRGSRPFGSYTVLCRTNAECGLYEGVAMELGIPVRLLGRSFWESRVVRDFAAYAALTRIDSSAALEQVYNRPLRYLPLGTVQLVSLRILSGQSLLDSLDLEIRRSRRALRRNLSSLRTDLVELRALGWPAQVERIAQWLRPSTDDAQLEGHAADEDGRQKLVDIVQNYALRLDDGLSFARYAEAAAAASRTRKAPANKRLTLSTIHRYKGLQSPVVAVVATRGRLPHDRGEPDEERRLFYVATTRAEDELWLGYAENADSGDPLGPSPFLAETGIAKILETHAGWLSAPHQAGRPGGLHV